MRIDPTNAGDVGDGEPISNKEARGGLLELSLEHAIQAASLVGVSVNAVLYLLRSIPCTGSQPPVS